MKILLFLATVAYPTCESPTPPPACNLDQRCDESCQGENEYCDQGCCVTLPGSSPICTAVEACGDPWTADQVEWCTAHTAPVTQSCILALTRVDCDALWAGDLPEACYDAA